MQSAVLDSLAFRRAGSVPWALNRPYFDLGQPVGEFPLHTHHVILMYSWLERGEYTRLGPSMAMTALFRRILIAESGLTEYRAARVTDLGPQLRTPGWDRLAELVIHARELPDTLRFAAGRTLVALTLYDDAVQLLSAPARNDPRTDDIAAGLTALSLSATYLAGSGSRPGLLARIREVLAVLPSSRVPAISIRMLQASLVSADGSRAALDGMCTELHEQVRRARPALGEIDWRRLAARVHALQARLLTQADAAEAAAHVRTAEEIIDTSATDPDDILLLAEARRRLLDRRCLLAQLSGDSAAALAAASTAVSVDAADSKAWLQLGNVQAQLGEAGDALRSYWRAGRMLDDLNRHDEAGHEYLRAAQLDPASSSVARALECAGERLGLSHMAGVARELLHQHRDARAVSLEEPAA
jgi:tetratricopeptide (TPR) repeat protein